MHEAHITKSHYEINSKDQGSLVFVEKGKKAQGKCAESKKGHDKNNVVLAFRSNSTHKEKNITVKKMHLYQ